MAKVWKPAHRSELKHEPHGALSLRSAAVSPRYPCGATLIPHLNSRDLRIGLALFTLSGEWELEVRVGSDVYHLQI